MRTRAVAVLAVPLLAAACTSSSGGSPGSSSAQNSSPSGVTGLGGGAGETSPTGSPTTTRPTTTAPTTSAPTTRTASAGPVRELPGPCPYISDLDARAAEGDRVGNVFRLSTTPVGCRFYFAYDDTAIILEITFRREASVDAGLDYLLGLTRAHPEYVTDTDIGAGAVSVKADLQGTATWQCSFVKGDYVVTVHTRQPDPSFNARKIARLIEPKVP